MGLSSIASLSLGLSMSMTGAGREVIRNLGVPIDALPGGPPYTYGGGGRRQSLQPMFPVLTAGVAGGGCSLGAGYDRNARRPSFVGILQTMSAQNRLLERASTIDWSAPRRSMDLVAEEQPPTPAPTPPSHAGGASPSSTSPPPQECLSTSDIQIRIDECNDDGVIIAPAPPDDDDDERRRRKTRESVNNSGAPVRRINNAE